MIVYRTKIVLFGLANIKIYFYFCIHEKKMVMRYISTRHSSPSVSLLDAILNTSAADGGVYLPEAIPQLPEAFFNNFKEMSPAEIAYVISNSLFGQDIDSAALKQIVNSVLNFPVVVNNVERNIYVLELFHGPTLAFKDFGARFMARLIEQSPRLSSLNRINIIVSTTGNTGSAIANAFAGIGKAHVYILFPPNSANRALERQFTTLGGNIHPIEIQGNIDDCAKLAKQVLVDRSLNDDKVVTISANSANVARLLPQTFYYFIGMAQLANRGIDLSKVVVSIPCGNFGNLCAAVISHKMGLPMSHILACENANATLGNAIRNGHFERRRSIPTLAYAADKGRPSNAERLISLFDNNIANISSMITPHAVDDRNIIDMINGCRNETGYLLDPHTALAYNGVKKHLKPGETALVLATAHPAKSLATMAAITGRALDMPLQLTAFMSGRDHRLRIPADYKKLKAIINASY